MEDSLQILAPSLCATAGYTPQQLSLPRGVILSGSENMKLELEVRVVFTQEQLEWIVNAISGIPRDRPALELDRLQEDLDAIRERVEEDLDKLVDDGVLAWSVEKGYHVRDEDDEKYTGDCEDLIPLCPACIRREHCGTGRVREFNIHVCEKFEQDPADGAVFGPHDPVECPNCDWQGPRDACFEKTSYVPDISRDRLITYLTCPECRYVWEQ